MSFLANGFFQTYFFFISRRVYSMGIKKKYSQAARVQGILRTLGARHEITLGELAGEFGVMKRILYRDLNALDEGGYH
jgi:hypothetical protein